MNNVIDTILDLAQEQAIKDGSYAEFADAACKIINLRTVLQNHFVSMTEDNRVFFDSGFTEEEIEIIKKCL